jgi:hypothetical protein
MHPNLAALCRRKVAQSRGVPAEPNATEGRDAVRNLIDKVIITPLRDEGDPPGCELVGERAAIVQAAGLCGTAGGLNPDGQPLCKQCT